MKKKSSNLLRKQTVIWTTTSLVLTFLVTSLILIAHSHSLLHRIYTNTIILETDKKTLELNNFFNDSQILVKSYEDFILDTLDEERLLTDEQYEIQFYEILSNLMANTAINHKGVVCTFFRMEIENFGPTRGVFLIGSYQKKYVNARPTNLSKFSPTDTDHVGWYYLPIWEKAPVWTSTYDNENIRQKIISYCVPVYRGEKLLGIVGVDVSLAYVEDIVHSLQLENSTGLLIGTQGNLIHLNTQEELANAVERSADIARLLDIFQSQEDDDKQKIHKFYWEGQNHYGTYTVLDNKMAYIYAVTQREVRDLLYGQRLAFIFSFILVSILTTLLINFIVNRIIRPVNIISQTTNRLARGELYIDIPYYSNNELGILADNIRKMTSQLKEYIEYISEQTKKERAAKEAALTESQINAAASQAKSAFLANMSHEIRTPINAVLGMNEMILRESKDKTILGYSTNIKIAGTSLLSIVNDVLDFSKIEAGKMELIPDNYEVSSLIIDLMNMTRERAQKKGLKYNLNINSTLPKTLYGDSIRIKQCILNLLTNAIKYTKEGSITFSIDYTKKSEDTILLTVHVKDTGCGIKKEDMEKLFAPFERIEEEKNRTIEGSGLGMSIVRRLLDMMKSQLEVQSTYGEGSDFAFTIEQQVTDWTPAGDLNEAYEESISLMANYKETLFAPKARLLFVDDTAMNLDVIKGLLKNTGMTVDTCLSGKEALEAVRKNTYDILFIDHRMPEMDGIETLHAMKELIGNLCIEKPCIALTANAISGVKKMYLNEGFDDYLSKPVNPAKLEEMIRKHLPQDYIEENAGAMNGDSSDSAVPSPSAFLTKIQQIAELDATSALTNCGSEELLQSTIAKYHASINEKALELQQYFEAEDWENYGIKVHALKSTSRLIGAMELSKLAEHLEECTNNNTVSEIQNNHKTLLDMYLAFRHILEPLLESEKEDTDKPEISPEELSAKLKQMADCADTFDIDGLDSLISELTSVKLPLDFSQKFDKIRTSIENVDFKELRILLTEGSNN